MKNTIKSLTGLGALWLLSTAPALAQIATDVECDGCVQSGDIATNGVRRADIQNFSVNTPKLNNFAVTSEKIKTAAVTTTKIANGAVTVAKVSPKLSRAIGTSCPAGEFVVGMDTTGRFICESKFNQAPDTDLTGKIYCYISPFTELIVDPGNSAAVTTGLVAGRIDFTSPTQFTNTELVDSTSAINLPANTMTIVDDVGAAEVGTYTVVGNRLALTFDDAGESYTAAFSLTTDGQVFIAGFFEGSDDGSNQADSGLAIGVQADSCD
jgi:hypothetical protein